jgi:hypothetical protein
MKKNLCIRGGPQAQMNSQPPPSYDSDVMTCYYVSLLVTQKVYCVLVLEIEGVK